MSSETAQRWYTALFPAGLTLMAALSAASVSGVAREHWDASHRFAFTGPFRYQIERPAPVNTRFEIAAPVTVKTYGPPAPAPLISPIRDAATPRREILARVEPAKPPKPVAPAPAAVADAVTEVTREPSTAGTALMETHNAASFDLTNRSALGVGAPQESARGDTAPAVARAPAPLDPAAPVATGILAEAERLPLGQTQNETPGAAKAMAATPRAAETAALAASPAAAKQDVAALSPAPAASSAREPTAAVSAPASELLPPLPSKMPRSMARAPTRSRSAVASRTPAQPSAPAAKPESSPPLSIFGGSNALPSWASSAFRHN